MDHNSNHNDDEEIAVEQISEVPNIISSTRTNPKMDHNSNHNDNEEIAVEQISEVPPWRKQLSFRALVVSFVLSVVFSLVVMKLDLTTGMIPSLNVSAALLGFFAVRVWSNFLHKSGKPFTRQENTVIQTSAVASFGISFSGGFGSYLFAMSEAIAKTSTEANRAQNIKNPGLAWMIGFLFLVSFLGLFSVVPLRKIMIIDFKLTYPSGTATGHLINSFHTPQGAKIARKQVRTLGKFLSLSFLWGFFQWFFTAGDGCGFAEFPTFGLKAYKNMFFFDFSATYVGVGMMCPYLINISVLAGAILSWGIMWPFIENKSGDWYSATLPPNSLHGIQGYRVFLAIAMILGDGLYNFVKILGRSLFLLYQKIREKNSGPVLLVGSNSSPTSSTPAEYYDDEHRTRLFLKDKIPTWVAVSGYIILAIISAATLPHIFHPLKWYFVVVMYIFAPILAFCNAYGCGLTDWSLASTYGKLAIFIIGAWAGASHGGVLAGLAACGVVMNIVSTASDLTQDFKTGYMTLASPRSMFVSQVIGTAMGCVIAPCIFCIFYKAFPNLGIPGSKYPAPYATIFRGIALLGVEGFSSLPYQCLTLWYVCFMAALVIQIVRDIAGPKWAKFIPIPMAMAIPFYLGASFAIDMCVGSLILFIWRTMDKEKADAFGPTVASGLICGDGIWTLPSSILSIAGVKPPICMKFLSRKTNARVDTLLG